MAAARHRRATSRIALSRGAALCCVLTLLNLPEVANGFGELFIECAHAMPRAGA
jgi:hypothetical protein